VYVEIFIQTGKSYTLQDNFWRKSIIINRPFNAVNKSTNEAFSLKQTTRVKRVKAKSVYMV
jgi:hypothetical protein